MGNLDFGKLTTIVLFFFAFTFFFGGEAMYWYKHQDDLKFSLTNISYTKEHFEKMEEVDQKALLEEVASLCVRKRHADNLNCADTTYWLADGLEDEGVDIDLVLPLMKTCSEACESRTAPPSLDDRPNKRKSI